MTTYVQPPLELGGLCQRWNRRRHTWRPAAEGGFDPSRYRVREIPTMLVREARAFVRTHHYSGSWPAVRFAYGLIDTTASSKTALVGVLTLGIPTQAAVLTSVFGSELTVYQQSLELNRLVLLDEVPANAESWMQAHAFRLAAARGLRGVVAHSDPEPRVRLTDHGQETVLPGHYGTIYQAKGMNYLGRTRPRNRTVLPDGSVLHDRALSKVRIGERGRGGVERRLVALGARQRAEREPGRAWLGEALHVVGARVVRHGGNHRYAAYIGPYAGRRIATTSYPYPKADHGGAAA
ncbi:hypothetical protein [Streptomyces sp. NPDC004286]|uniref:Mom family adenine methylcarbamoylation protein n=1 Tax=Streptomyces sp. NPDC004286 TaxID=3364696 RepID=UPI003696E433